MAERIRCRNRKQSQSSQSNGYILEPALILFSLSLLFSLYAAAAVQSKSALIQASRRSRIDLAIIQRAAELAGDLSWSRRCLQDINLTDRHETIAGIPVAFRDHQSYLEASYSQNSRTFHIDLYYDEDGILKVEYPDSRQ